ncbi:GNAT family N-acyltransferase [Caenimonas sp. SL110]|uniref:N-acyl amino acid synthase FeeM domain-containing protein n=1 Tax=Caenimonas sp. SL110 TaxID=1450524 RepID=UPI000653D724|nr:GNAT family N-acyltransferase [Caenimonas sp. SL110]
METFVTRPHALEIRRADVDTNLFDQIQRLRYQVYCVERNFLDASRYPEGRESDEFDDSSIHYCAVDTSGCITAAVRLVLHGNHGFPLLRYCSLYPQELDAIRRAPLRSAEVSRLVMSRNRGDHSGTKVALQLYRELFRTARLLGVTQLIAASERSLVRLLNRDHINSRQIGPESQFSGSVTPYATPVSTLAGAPKPLCSIAA